MERDRQHDAGGLRRENMVLWIRAALMSKPSGPLVTMFGWTLRTNREL